MKKRKVLFTAVMVLAGLQLLSGCGKTEASANDTVVLRYAYASNSQPVIDSMKKFGELVEEKTDGKVQIEYFPDGQFGGETELIELTQTGAIDFAKVSGSALESFSKDYSVFAIPYIFDNEKHFFENSNHGNVFIISYLLYVLMHGETLPSAAIADATGSIVIHLMNASASSGCLLFLETAREPPP